MSSFARGSTRRRVACWRVPYCVVFIHSCCTPLTSSPSPLPLPLPVCLPAASEWDIFHAIREAGEAAVDTGAGMEYPPTPAGDAGAGAAVSTDATTADKGEAKAGEQAAADGDGSAPEVQSGDAAGAGAAASSSTSGAASEPAAAGDADGIVAQVGDGAEQKPAASAETAALSSSASDAAGAVGSGDGESKSAASKAEPEGGLSEAAALKKKLDDLRDACKPHRQRMVLAVSTGGRDRNFGFIDLPSAAVADLILSLDGKVTCNGSRLMISRPRDYPRPARGTGAGAGGDDQWGRVGAGRDQQRDGRGVGSGDVGSSSGSGSRGMAIPRKAAQPTDGSAPGSSSSASAAAPAAGHQHQPSTASSAAPSFVSVSGPPRRNRWGGDAGVGIQNDHGGGVIALSNTKRTAMLVERYTTTNIVDDDAMAELRARLGIAAPAPPPAPAPAPAADAGGAGGGSESAAPGSAGSDANPQQPAHQQAQQQFIPSTIGGMPITLPGHGIGSGSGGVNMSNMQLPMGMQPSGLVSMPILAAAAAAATGGPSGAAATANIAGAQMMALPGLAALGGGGGNLGLGLGLGMPSGLSSITGTAANVNVQVGSSPAQAAGMLGPGGIVSLLAAVTPTRILVLLNAVSDVDFKATDHADVLADIACEAQKHGVLLRAVMPLPKPGESLEPNIERPEILKKVGAAGLLEDSREALAGGSAAQMNVPKNAQEFYKRTMGGPDARGNAGVASSGYHDDGDEEGEGEWVPGQNPFKDTSGRTKGLGRIFLEFQDATAATAAQKELSGRFFNGRILVATFADERKFMRGDLCDLGQPGCDVVAGPELVD